MEGRHTQSKPVPIDGVLLEIGSSLLRVTHGDRDVLQNDNEHNQPGAYPVALQRQVYMYTWYACIPGGLIEEGIGEREIRRGKDSG